MPKKILYLITKSDWGGAQRYVHDLAVALPSERYDVVVALGGNGPLIQKLEEALVKVVKISALQRDVSVVKELISVWQISSIIRQEKPEVLHINSSKAGILGVLMGRILLVPKIIFTSHGWAFNEKRPWYQKVVFKFIHWLTVLLSHQTIAVSYELKRQMNWLFAEKKMVVIHNGRTIKNLLERNEARDRLISHDDRLKPYRNDFWSVTIGELHPVKQHDVTIKAIAKLVEKHPNVRHIIISGGEEKENLQALISDLKLTRNVFLLGAIDEASQYLKAFDLFVLASRSEALAYVVIEACIAGLPIIASRVGGIPEIIENGESGYLVPGGNVSALAHAYTELLTNPQDRDSLGKAASDRSKHFTFKKTLEETVSLY